jgi:hypothetical protein
MHMYMRFVRAPRERLSGVRNTLTARNVCDRALTGPGLCMRLDLAELECDTAAPLAAIVGLNMRELSKPSRSRATVGYVSLHWQLTAATHTAPRAGFCAAFRQILAHTSAAHSSAEPRSDDSQRHAQRSRPDLSRKRRLTQRSSQCVFVWSGNSTFRAVYATSVSTHR